jgi:hypothetical protein
MSKGLIEIKSAIASVHYERIRKDTFDSKYKWQFIHNLKESGRDWIDFVSYCSSYPKETQLFVKRLERRDFTEQYAMIDERLGEFFKLIETAKQRINGGVGNRADSLIRVA